MNEGGRVDYVLQSSKVEVANEYISALKAHSSYWSHPDVAAFVVKEIFALNQSTASVSGIDSRIGCSCVLLYCSRTGNMMEGEGTLHHFPCTGSSGRQEARTIRRGGE